MPPDIAYVATYPCPRCAAMLDAVTDEWRDWLRCPSCGRASRPPYERGPHGPTADDVLYIGTFVTGSSASANGSASARAPVGLPNRDGTGRRALLGGGFFLAVVLALTSVARKDPGQAGIFGFAAFLLLVFLAQSSRRA